MLSVPSCGSAKKACFAQSHAISTVVRKRKESLLRFGGATPCVVRSRDSVSVALCRVAHYRGCQYRQKPRTVVRSSTGEIVPFTFSPCRVLVSVGRDVMVCTESVA